MNALIQNISAQDIWGSWLDPQSYLYNVVTHEFTEFGPRQLHFQDIQIRLAWLGPTSEVIIAIREAVYTHNTLADAVQLFYTKATLLLHTDKFDATPFGVRRYLLHIRMVIRMGGYTEEETQCCHRAIQHILSLIEQGSLDASSPPLVSIEIFKCCFSVFFRDNTPLIIRELYDTALIQSELAQRVFFEMTNLKAHHLWNVFQNKTPFRSLCVKPQLFDDVWDRFNRALDTNYPLYFVDEDIQLFEYS